MANGKTQPFHSPFATPHSRLKRFVLGGPGNDLLSRVLRHSTIGAEEFNGRVRDGIGFLAPRSSHRTGKGQRQARPHGSALGLDPRTHASGEWRMANGRVSLFPFAIRHSRSFTDIDHKSDQADRAISTSQLNASPRLHLWPIDVVVFHGSQGRTRFKGGFPLRCLQRLSRPYIATLHCGGRHNSSTRGTSIPVLSY
jgi:hypothetical protein